jgi:leader peptidase (prepilin peptidase) / N-methyltransferase
MLPTLSLAAIALAPGLALGSFLNVIASRVPAGLAIGASRSACMSCGTPIRWSDNIPLVSFLLLRGRCRSCEAAIPVRYPLVEGLTAALAAACLIVFGLTAEGLLAAAFCAVLVVLSAIDVEHRIVPNRIVLPAAAAALVAHTLIDPSPEWLLAALGASGFLLVAALVHPRGMGMGDVKLALLLGAVLGRDVALALLIGMIAALAPAVVVAARGGSIRKLAVPFVPFLALGSVIALFWGDVLLDAYLRLLA